MATAVATVATQLLGRISFTRFHPFIQVSLGFVSSRAFIAIGLDLGVYGVSTASMRRNNKGDTTCLTPRPSSKRVLSASQTNMAQTCQDSTHVWIGPRSALTIDQRYVNMYV